MQNATTKTWDDPNHNRTIQVDVSFTLTETGVAINEITPTNVIIRNDNGEPRTIGVHTEKGRRHLSDLISKQALTEAIETAFATTIS